MTVRRQVEATSEFAVSHKPTTLKGTGVCPDCTAELAIKRREDMQTVIRPSEAVRALSAMHLDHNGSLITTNELPHGLDAVIIERGGVLEDVILADSSRSAETLRRLSKDLLCVSQALSHAGSPLPTSTISPTRAAILEKSLPPITTVSQPYHHAPEVPRSLHVAQWADANLREALRIMHTAELVLTT